VLNVSSEFPDLNITLLNKYNENVMFNLKYQVTKLPNDIYLHTIHIPSKNTKVDTLITRLLILHSSTELYSSTASVFQILAVQKFGNIK
jgi:hypothetical protein